MPDQDFCQPPIFKKFDVWNLIKKEAITLEESREELQKEYDEATVKAEQ